MVAATSVWKKTPQIKLFYDNSPPLYPPETPPLLDVFNVFESHDEGPLQEGLQTSLLSEPPSPDILHFCARQAIHPYLQTALELIDQHFSGIQAVHLELEQDPEADDDKWVVIHVTLVGDIDSVLQSYEQYTSQWIARVPWPACSKIRLSYNIM
jgi:hypothetical protein